jgi:hypothetical protein
VRLATMVVALCVSSVQGFVALAAVAIPGETRSAVAALALAAATLTFVGAMLGIIHRTVVAPALVAGGQLVFAGLVVVEIVRAWMDSRDLGTDAAWVVLLGVLLATFAGIAFTALLSSVPKQAGLAVAGAFVLTGAGVALAGAAAGATGADCDRFRFDPQRWSASGWDDRVQIETSVARCGTLHGWSREAVRALPGQPLSGSRSTLWSSLTIEYDRTGHVDRVTSSQYD